jgi:hypothetical protein
MLVCLNLQFSSTKWAKAYLIHYILDKLQELKVRVISSFFALCHGLSDKDLHDFEKNISKLWRGGGAAAPRPSCYGPVYMMLD